MKIDGKKVSRLSSFLLVSQMFALEKTSGMWLVHEKSYQTFVQQKVKPFLDLIIMHTARIDIYNTIAVAICHLYPLTMNYLEEIIITFRQDILNLELNR